MSTQERWTSLLPLIFFFVVLFVDSTLLIMTHTGWQASQSYYVPLRDQIANTKLVMAESHLWLEEYLDDDPSIDPERLILAPIRAVIRDTNAQRQAIHQQPLAESDPSIASNLQRMEEQLEQYQGAIIRRMENKSTQGIGSEADAAFDAMYHDVERTFVDESSRIYEKMIAETKRRNGFFAIALGVFLSANLAALTALLYYRRDKKRNDALLHEQKELAEITLASIGDGVITTDAKGHIQQINAVAAEITKWDRDSIRGKKLIEYFTIINETTREPASNPLTLALETGRVVQMANGTVLVNECGTEIPIEDSAAPIRNSADEIVGAVIVFRDVSARRAMNRQLAWEASHDSLTRISNRNHFKSSLEKVLRQKRTTQNQLFFIDLDNFKPINDTAGHMAGDEVLQSVAFNLRQSVRFDDCVARLGGDEFGVLLSDCDSNQGNKIASTLINRIRSLQFEWDGDQYRIGVSIGHISFPTPAKSVGFMQLMRLADDACYTAKHKGKNNIHFRSVSNDDLTSLPSNEDGRWIKKINQAVDKEQFELFVQNIVPFDKIRKTRYEILIRLKSNGGYLKPNAFLSVARRYRLMQDIDYWVIGTLFDHIQQNALLRPLCFNVNITGQTLESSGLTKHLIQELAEHPAVQAQNITFEITETSLLDNIEETSGVISALKAIGFSFALDDFGTGAATFSYLRKLPVDFVKIDGSFVRDMVTDPVSEVTVRSMHNVCTVLGKQTVAEYVENRAIFDRIAELGIDYAQGFYIHKPSPLTTLT